MEFRILGPVEVLDGERPLPLGGPKQRALLALLLLHANEAVSADRLVEALWGEEPPETARASVQVYVSRLRKLLGEALASSPGGYLLRVAPEELDLDRFEALAAEGRSTLARGEAGTAAARLHEALGLWRGPALADLAYEPFAQSAVARLEELRLACLEDCLDADLALGRQGELVAELEELVAAHPLRERLRGQLMLALYRSGRQAEALDAYQEGRRALVEQLGLEPGPGLQRLERAILNQDPELEPPARTEPAAAPAWEPGARKTVTVVFGAVDHSPPPGGLDPEALSGLLDECFASATEILERHGATVVRLVGNELAAVFGVPAVHEDDPARALGAALELCRDAPALLAASAARWDTRIEVRAGVETGEVVTGDPSHGRPSVTGEAATAAARLAAAAGAGEVLVGERAATAGGGAFELGEPFSPDRGGQRPAATARRLLGPTAGVRARRGLAPGFVGREAELALLQARYRTVAREAEPRLVTVVGEAGVGKTRLVRELWAWLAAQDPLPRLRSGRCLSYGRGVTYWPLGEILKEELGLLESDPPETVRERLAGREILGMTLGLDAAPGLHPLVARDRLHVAWRGLLQELVDSGPAVLLVEDLHWAEDPLLDLLDHLVRHARGPLLLVATARPELLEGRPGWGSGRRETRLWLEPLAPDEAETMLVSVVGAAVPERLRAAVLEPAEGNPFFIEELLSELLDRGALERTPEGWSLRAVPASVALPDSVQGVISARVDRLQPAERAALQAASVVGRRFWVGPLGELLGGSAPDLSALESRDFVRRRASSSLQGEEEWTFKHALTREVAYASLPRGRRARLHAAFADWIERVGEGRDEHAPLLAHHYAEATRPESAALAWPDDEEEAGRLRTKAVAWLRRAAELACARYAVDDAIALLERALEREPEAREQAALWREIGRASALRYDGETFWTAHLRAIELTEDAAQQGDLYSELAIETLASPAMWARRPENEKVAEWIERALALSEPGSPAYARTLAARAFAEPVANPGDAVEARRIAEQLGDERLYLRAWRAGLEALIAEERYEEARAGLDQVVSRRESFDPDLHEGIYWTGLLAEAGSGRLDEAARYARILDETSSPLTPHHAVHGVGTKLMADELAGDFAAARELVTEAEERVAANLATPCAFNARSLLVCALASQAVGDGDEARRLERAADELGMEGYGLSVEAPRIRLALLRGDLVTVGRTVAGPLLTMSLARLASVAARLDGLAALRDRKRVEEEATPLLRSGTYLEPFALRALGIVRSDDEQVEAALARFAALGLDWHARQTPLLRGE